MIWSTAAEKSFVDGGGGEVEDLEGTYAKGDEGGRPWSSCDWR